MRWLSRQARIGSLVAMGVLGMATAATAQAVNTYTNSTVIVITDNANATPFPSSITVAGQTGVVTHVRVRLNQISHNAPLDLTVWLVGPNFATVPILARPPTSQLSAANLEFDECAPRTAAYPNAATFNTSPALPSGRYRPGIYPAAGVASFPNPTGEFPTRLTSLEGIQGNGSWSLYVKDNAPGTSGVIAGGWSLTLYSQPTSPVTGFGFSGPSCAKPDYDGDGRADIAVYRPASGEWFIYGSATNTNIYYAWGAPSSTGVGDIPVPADYDGDGQTDVAVYRQTTGTWYIRYSGGGTAALAFGAPSSTGLGDIPVPTDYDGDGAAELAIYRKTTGVWYVRHTNGGGVTITAWGAPGFGDIPGRY
jgi:subtilisin-like proprotein convertase family protein